MEDNNMRSFASEGQRGEKPEPTTTYFFLALTMTHYMAQYSLVQMLHEGTTPQSPYLQSFIW